MPFGHAAEKQENRLIGRDRQGLSRVALIDRIEFRRIGSVVDGLGRAPVGTLAGNVLLEIRMIEHHAIRQADGQAENRVYDPNVESAHEVVINVSGLFLHAGMNVQDHTNAEQFRKDMTDEERIGPDDQAGRTPLREKVQIGDV